MHVRKNAHLRLREAAVVWVDPRRISLQVLTATPATENVRNALRKPLHHPLTTWPLRVAIAAFDPYVVPSHHYPEAQPVEATARYRKVYDFIHHRDTPRATLWFHALRKSLEERGVARHKKVTMKCEGDIERFFSGYVIPLIESLQRDGFRVEAGGGIGSALIAADGALHKSDSSNHRFCMARILGLTRFPVRVVGVHRVSHDAHVQPSSLARLRHGISAVAAAHRA
jgi:hypothetical protein